MVPHNQDVFLIPLEDNAFTYLAQAYDVRKDEWQPFCHHGGGYAVSVAFVTQIARWLMPNVDGMAFFTEGSELPIIGGWALFYWRLRYRLKPVQSTNAAGDIVWTAQVEERFSFKDEAATLKL
jgi:hypothetical protein